MPRRSLPTLVAPLGLVLLLFGCGNPSSDATSEATPPDEAVEQTDAPEETGSEYAQEGAEGYGEVDQGGYAEIEGGGQAEADRGYGVQPAPARRVPQQVATPRVGAGVRGDVGMFYDALDRDGSWVSHPDYSYVWIPSRMGPGWRPYQEGRWIWTDDYGWYWESEEPGAWAVYHYGRWDYDPDYGWFWVPGDTWAPAWVSWRVGGNSVGWSPIAPDRPGFAAGMPRRYAPPVAESWVFVDAPNFASPDVAAHVLPISRIGPSLESAREIRTPRFERNHVVNFGAPPDEMRRYVRGPIPTRQLVYVGNLNDMFDDVPGRRVGIYRPTISAGERRGAPRRLGDVRRTERIVILDFAGPGPERLYDAPSVALLDVLDPRERQGLIEARQTAKQASIDARIDQLQRQRAALVEERRKQAKKLEAKIEKERQAAKAERKRLRETVRAQKEERAARIKIEAPLPSGEAAAQTPGAVDNAKPEAAPVQGAAVPAQPAPPSNAEAPPAPAPAPVETGAVDSGNAEPVTTPEEQDAPALGAAEPAPETAPAAAAPEPAPAPPPAPIPAAEPAPEPAAVPQQAEETPAAVAPQGQPRKQRRPMEAAKPEQAAPVEEAPAPGEAAPPPPPDATEAPPPAAPGPAAGMPSDPSAAMGARKAKRTAVPEEPAIDAAPEPPSDMGQEPPGVIPSDPAPPPPAE